jgi:hypothetical protein
MTPLAGHGFFGDELTSPPSRGNGTDEPGGIHDVNGSASGFGTKPGYATTSGVNHRGDSAGTK